MNSLESHQVKDVVDSDVARMLGKQARSMISDRRLPLWPLDRHCRALRPPPVASACPSANEVLLYTSLDCPSFSSWIDVLCTYLY